MISFFRSFFNSKIGLFLTFAFVALIAVAFATADVSNTTSFGGASGGGTAAEVGDSAISIAELEQSVNNAFRAEQRRNPALTLQSFVADGGFDDVLDRLINSYAIAEYGRKYGMAAGKRLVDSEITQIPAFQGANGEFSEEVFRTALQQQGIKEQDLRADFTRNLIADQLLPSAGFGAYAPRKIIAPYAALLLERREGQIQIVPAAAFLPKTKASDAELAAFFSKNSARYTIPERRAVSYALIERSRFNSSVSVAAKDIAAYYNANKADYAASESRDLDQIIAPTEAAAKALAARAAKGEDLRVVAESAGLAAAEIGLITKSAFAKNTSPAVADAAFAASDGGIAKPAQGPLGWHVVKVSEVRQTPGRSLAQATPEIENLLRRQKVAEALTNLITQLQDEFANGTTLAEVAEAEKLKVETTPRLLANGQNPEDQNYRAIPEMAKILPTAFGMVDGDEPELVELIPDQQYAIVALSEISEAAPPPLARIRQLVERDYMLSQGDKQAEALARKLAKAAQGGQSLAAAVRAAKVAQLPAINPISATRTDLARQGQAAPPPLALLFSMAEGTAKPLKAPRDQGWFVVSLNKIIRGDAAQRPDLLDATRQQFRGFLGQEYVAQFINALKADVGVKRNDAAIKTLKDRLTGAATSSN